MYLSLVSIFYTVRVVYLTGSSQYLRASSYAHSVFEGSSIVHFRAYLIGIVFGTSSPVLEGVISYAVYLGDPLLYLRVTHENTGLMHT